MNLKFGITYKTREKKEESNVEVDEYGALCKQRFLGGANIFFLYCEITEPFF